MTLKIMYIRLLPLLKVRKKTLGQEISVYLMNYKTGKKKFKKVTSKLDIKES